MPFPNHTDPVVAFLENTFDADIVRVPETRIQPLCVVAGDQQNSRAIILGPLTQCLKPIPPALQTATPLTSPLANVSGKRTHDIDIAFGIQILNGILQGFGLGSLGITAQLQQFQQMSFTFDNVTRRYFTDLWLGAVLEDSAVDLKNAAIAGCFTGENQGQNLFLVVDSIIVSDTFSVTVNLSNTPDVQLDVPAIQQLVANVSTKVSVSTNATNEVSFHGPEPLTFAFTCVQFTLDPTSGTISTIQPAPNTFPAVAGGQPAAQRSVPVGPTPGATGAVLQPQHVRIGQPWTATDVTYT